MRLAFQANPIIVIATFKVTKKQVRLDLMYTEDAQKTLFDFCNGLILLDTKALKLQKSGFLYKMC